VIKGTAPAPWPVVWATLCMRKLRQHPASEYPRIALSDGDSIRVSNSEPVVETEHGRIRG
jgi:hypothetical protein